MTWDPGQYDLFAERRLRPALDLAAHVGREAARLVCDLGCGSGGLVRRFAERWPEARVIGVDSSPEMLARASGAPGRVEWVRADVATWEPPGAVDVLYSNAALHWVPDHVRLFPRLARLLAPGGVLAVQMPLSWDEPSHRLMREVLAAGGPAGRPLGSAALRESLAGPPVLPAEEYHDLLAPLVSGIDSWETRYHHFLEGEDPVLEWVKGTGLRPVLEGLAEEPGERERFLAAYRQALRGAYPRRGDGRTLYPFPRLFLVARR